MYNIAMTKEEFTLKSRQDDLELGVSLRIPEHPLGIIQLVHGMAEHRERYHDFMDYLAEQGYVVIIHDHRGHGASVKSTDDYGYFYENGLEAIIKDVHQITGYIRERFPELPLTLFGHSMGSLIVRCYMQEYDKSVDGLIVCGSPSKRFGASLAVLIAKTIQLFRGDHYRSNFVNRLAFPNYNQKSARLALANGNTTAKNSYTSPNSWIVSDPAVVAAYDADERDGFTFTLNGFIVLFNLLKRAYSKKGWQMHNPEVPILFIAGADDPCIISPKDFEKAVNFMRERGYRHLRSKLYPGMRHEILNEIGKTAVWSDVASWNKARVLSSHDQ